MSVLYYSKAVFLIIAIIFNVLTVIVVVSIIENKRKLRLSVLLDQRRMKNELAFFPRYCSTRAVICYVVTLVLVSAFYFSHAMPFQFILFGFVAVAVFFMYANKLTMKWSKITPHSFVKKLFVTALWLRVGYVIFVYFYYIGMTGQPHMYHPGDELWYHDICSQWREYGFETFSNTLSLIDMSDSGYCWWLAFEYLVFGTHVLPARLIKCLIDSFSCVLIYSLAERNFGEYTGRIAGVFYMLMINTWYYCGITLKETEMAFMVILFVERADLAVHSLKIKLKDLLIPLLVIVVMFTFRTALATVLVGALGAAIILSSNRQLQLWKKILFSAIFAIWMIFTVGVEMAQEAQMLWEGRMENQEVGYAWRAEQEGGNAFAKYASASIFAPMIFTLPFSTMVDVVGQENQMMLNGGNFIKNVLSGFTIFALFLLLFRKEWRQHVLPLAVMCGYLVVLVFSNFAHSERFHFPILGLELMFAAFGVSQMTNKHKRWYMIWMVIVVVANFAWAVVKLKGRGLA